MLETENNRHVLGANKMPCRSDIYRQRTTTFVLVSVTTDSL